MSEYQNKRWAWIRNAMNDWSLEDCYSLRKAMTLNQVNKFWELGMQHIANLQMLNVMFGYDDIVRRIYEHMLERANDRFKLRFENEEYMDMHDYEYIFRDQPVVPAVGEEIMNGVNLYDVHKCFYKRRLVYKYPKQYDFIVDMIEMGA